MDKLTENLINLTRLAQSDVVCPICGRMIDEDDEVEFVKLYGKCLMCDAEETEIARREYEEVNKEGGEDNDNSRLYFE